MLFCPQVLGFFNTFIPSLSVMTILFTPSADLLPFWAIQIPFCLLNIAIFVMFLSSVHEYGWDPNAMYMWLTIISVFLGVATLTVFDLMSPPATPIASPGN